MTLSRSSLAKLAQAEELTLLGIVDLGVSDAYAAYRRWLSEGKHAGMAYLARDSGLRGEPERLLKGARSAVLLGLFYDQGDGLGTPDLPRVAQYARFADYHKILRKKGEKIAAHLPGQSRVVVDSAPLLERALAAKSALGFIGKNTCYIHPERGSFLLLAEILTTMDLERDQKVPVNPSVHDRHGGCGACKECQVHCPTNALSKDYEIDSSRCLAYWTIENRGPIPEEFWPWLSVYYFGCDICQLVCPYNLRARESHLPKSIAVRSFPSLFETATMNQNQYEQYFGGTPLTRAKRNGLRRNALIAMFVTGNSRLDEAIELAERDCDSPIKETLEQMRRYRKDAFSFPDALWRKNHSSNSASFHP